MPTPTPTPSAAVPLGRFVNAAHWEAEDLAGRTSIVAHAAFLRAGFVPCGAVPTTFGDLLLKHVDEIGPSAPTLSRRYTAPQLVDDGAEAEVAVLEIRAQGDGDVAFQAYILLTSESDGGHRIRRCSCEAVLREADLAPILSGGLDDTARALETGGAGSWLWKSLADGVCRVLFLDLCRRNDLPVTEFMSLPDDAMVQILKRLPSGKDLAKVECCSRPLRRLVEERDGEVWKAMYETGLGLVAEEKEQCVNVPSTWKQRHMYALAAQPPPLPSSTSRSSPFRSLHEVLTRFDEILREHMDDWFAPPSPHPFLFVPSRLRMENRFIMEPDVESMDFFMPPFLDPPAAPAPAPEVVARSRQFGGGRQRKVRQVPQKDHKKKRHGAGATHSPSSRYRWRHR